MYPLLQCIIWDVARGQPLNVISCHSNTIYSISWNPNGSLFATSCKDKKIRVIDPRTGCVLQVWLYVLYISRWLQQIFSWSYVYIYAVIQIGCIFILYRKVLATLDSSLVKLYLLIITVCLLLASLRVETEKLLCGML